MTVTKYLLNQIPYRSVDLVYHARMQAHTFTNRQNMIHILKFTFEITDHSGDTWMGIVQAGPSYTRLKMPIPVVLAAVTETPDPLNELGMGVL
jgi:hypothetical protein